MKQKVRALDSEVLFTKPTRAALPFVSFLQATCVCLPSDSIITQKHEQRQIEFRGILYDHDSIGKFLLFSSISAWRQFGFLIWKEH
jgi:hypothetical protein